MARVGRFDIPRSSIQKWRRRESKNSGDEVVVGRQILIQQQNYISMWLALQLSHNDVLGVGLGWVLGLGGPESLPKSAAHHPSISGSFKIIFGPILRIHICL